jgi:hypothetical protein
MGRFFFERLAVKETVKEFHGFKITLSVDTHQL